MVEYKDLYDESFLEQFDENRESIERLSATESFIDVSEIARIFNVTINYEDIDHSGHESDGNITVNKWEPEVRQRFTIAHELGHIILGHSDSGIMNFRDENHERYSDVLSRMNEVSANKFAAELLMPRKLVRRVIYQVIDDLGYSLDQNFDNSDIDNIVEQGAKLLRVSKESFRYRIDNLGVFVDA